MPSKPNVVNIKQKTNEKPKPGVKPVAPAPARKKSRVMPLVSVLLVLCVALGGSYYWYRYKYKAKGGGAPKAAAPATLGPFDTLTLSSVTVNLAGGDGHYLRTTVVLQYPQKDGALGEELKKDQYIIVDKEINDLRTETYSELSTTQGEENLKKKLLHDINGLLTKGKLTGVFFDEFLMQ